MDIPFYSCLNRKEVQSFSLWAGIELGAFIYTQGRRHTLSLLHGICNLCYARPPQLQFCVLSHPHSHHFLTNMEGTFSKIPNVLIGPEKDGDPLIWVNIQLQNSAFCHLEVINNIIMTISFPPLFTCLRCKLDLHSTNLYIVRYVSVSSTTETCQEMITDNSRNILELGTLSGSFEAYTYHLFSAWFISSHIWHFEINAFRHKP